MELIKGKKNKSKNKSKIEEGGLFTIYDRAAEEHSHPFYAKTKMVAIRQFKRTIDPVIYKEDYSLHYIGRFSMQTGQGELIEPMQIDMIDAYNEEKKENK
jgi:hypothetical protein